jgi:hypothetical protein
MSTVDLRPVRASALLMGGVAAVWSVVPHPPMCPLLAATDIPCPLCGATRAVVAALRGDVAASLRYSPIGIVVIAVVVASIALWRRRTIDVPIWPVYALLGATWLWNLTLNPTFT